MFIEFAGFKHIEEAFNSCFAVEKITADSLMTKE